MDSIDQNVSFEDFCSKRAEAILNGELKDEDPDALQVDPISWPFLAEINKLGFITNNSQDAVLSSKISDSLMERPYVSGYIQTSKLSVFSSSIENETSLLFVNHIIVDKIDWDIQTRIPVTVYTKRWAQYISRKQHATSIPIFVEKKGLKVSDEHLDIPKTFELSVITIIDQRQNYRADKKDGLFKNVIKCLSTC